MSTQKEKVILGLAVTLICAVVMCIGASIGSMCTYYQIAQSRLWASTDSPDGEYDKRVSLTYAVEGFEKLNLGDYKAAHILASKAALQNASWSLPYLLTASCVLHDGDKAGAAELVAQAAFFLSYEKPDDFPFSCLPKCMGLTKTECVKRARSLRADVGVESQLWGTDLWDSL